MAKDEISNSNHPIMKFESKKEHTPAYYYSEWLAFMENMSPKGFLPHMLNGSKFTRRDLHVEVLNRFLCWILLVQSSTTRPE